VSVRIEPLAVLGDPVRLQPLAERIFGKGSRRDDWLARKLVRECVDPHLSRIAIDGDTDDPDAWQGYVLVGTPASRHPAARTAGTGVAPHARGRGLGRALVESALLAVARAGDHDALEILAEHGREPFYERLGFARVRPFATLLAFGRGPENAVLELPPPLPWDPEIGCREHQGFLAEAWHGTPAHERGSFAIATPHGNAIVHVCRENRALAIHRTVVTTADAKRDDTIADAALDALLARVPAATPVVLVGTHRVSSVTDDSPQSPHSRWIVVQRGTLVRARAGQRAGGPR
jgi:GNAT superfamily N-acetyltransferase